MKLLDCVSCCVYVLFVTWPVQKMRLQRGKQVLHDHAWLEIELAFIPAQYEDKLLCHPLTLCILTSWLDKPTGVCIHLTQMQESSVHANVTRSAKHAQTQARTCILPLTASEASCPVCCTVLAAWVPASLTDSAACPAFSLAAPVASCAHWLIRSLAMRYVIFVFLNASCKEQLDDFVLAFLIACCKEQLDDFVLARKYIGRFSPQKTHLCWTSSSS